MELSLDSLEGLLGAGDVDEVQNDRLVLAEELATKR